MPAATFTPVDDVVSQATSAGFFPGRHAVDVTDVRRLSDGVFRLTFRDGYIAAHAKAAQFVNLFSHDSMMLMPRPFGVSEVRDDLVSVIFAVVGKGTQEFSRLHAGDRIDVLGPLGRPFNTKRDAHYLLVGGGLGVPPLIYAAQRLQASEKSHSTAVFGYRNVHFADEIVLSCGPLPMMKAVALWTTARGIECQLSMEQRMGCGYGTCVTCVVDTVAGRSKVCSDGPVFTAQQLGWEA